MRSTRKLYYLHPKTAKYQAKIVKVHESSIELDQTIAYPEGDGQEGDRGHIFLESNPETNIYFHNTQLSMATPLFISNFPNCKSGGIILHHISNKNMLSQFNEGDEVNIEVDYLRREMLSRSHSATHIMYWAIDLFIKDIVEHTIGCHIKTDSGRSDFATPHRFTQDDLLKIESIANDIIDNAYPIKVYPHDNYQDARYWVCEDYIIPCGGTHVENTGNIPKLKLRRKNIGKNKERIIFTWLHEEVI